MAEEVSSSCSRHSADASGGRGRPFTCRSTASSKRGGWTLEVEDHEGGCTVWDDKFATDQAALDEVMKVIDTEGIGTFLVDQDKPTLH